MDGIRIAVRALFLDYPVDEVIQLIVKGNASLLGIFPRLSNAREPRHNQASMEALKCLASSTWMGFRLGKSTSDEMHRALRLPFLYADHCLSYDDNNKTGTVNFDELLRWHEMARYVGEDMMTINYLAQKDVAHNYTRTDFSWNPILNHNCEQLHKTIRETCREGLVDTHMHFHASTDLFSLNWICLMNNILELKQQFNDLKYPLDSPLLVTKHYHYEDMYKWCVMAYLIRWELYKKYIAADAHAFDKGFETRFEHIAKMGPFHYFSNLRTWQGRLNRIRRTAQKTADGQLFDYAIREDLLSQDTGNKEPFAILHGERYLLYHFYHDYWTEQREAFGISKYVYLYELIKCQLRRELVQINTISGLGNFKEYNKRKSLFVENGLGLTALKYAVQSSIANDKDGLEVRIMPQANRQAYQSMMNANYQQCVFMNEDKMDRSSLQSRMRFVTHFSKTPCDNNRHSKLRGLLKNQAECLVEDVFKKEDTNRLVAIDACGAETNCRPEVFAHAFRYCKLKGLWNFTYHVGEDFYDITDGLRAIEEAIRLFQLDEHCRLGHCLALGIDAHLYYKHRNRAVVMPKQILLDNLVWLLEMADKYHLCLPTKMEAEIEAKIERLYGEIGYQQPFSRESYHRSMLLRGDESKQFERCSNEGWNKTTKDDLVSALVREDTIAVSLMNDYYQSPSVYKNGFLSSEEFKIPFGYDRIIKKLQNKIIRMIYTKGICIETNPTSNLRVGRLDKYDNHPIFRFSNASLLHRNLKVTVNTDDKGIFETSLERELALLAISQCKQKNKNGRNKWKKTSVYNYIGKLARNGAQYRFK